MHIAALVVSLISSLLWFLPVPLDDGWWLVPVGASLIAMGLAVAALKRGDGRPMAISALVIAILSGAAVPSWMLAGDEPPPAPDASEEEVIVVPSDSGDPGLPE